MLRSLALTTLILLVSSPSLSQEVVEEESRSVRLQLHWTNQGAELSSVLWSTHEPRPQTVLSDPRVRIAEYPNAEGRWTGQPVQVERSASVHYLAPSKVEDPLLLQHRSLGSITLSVPPPGEHLARDIAPELIEVRNSGEPASRQDWVFLAEGYRLEDRAQFLADIDENLAYLEGLEPYSRYMSLVNVWGLFLESPEAGADHLELTPQTFVETPLGCHYGAYGIDRLIDCDADAVLTASAYAPGEDVRIVLVNDPTYGGSGGSTFAVSFTGTEMVQAVAHEMAHSDGGLADEYSYGIDSSTPSWGTDFPNCSPSETEVPWEHWIEKQSPGIDAYLTCSYTDYFRPSDSSCTMHSLQDTFCVVCRESLVRTIYGHLDRLIIDTSNEFSVLAQDDFIELEVQTISLVGTPMHVRWVLESDDEGAPPTLLAEGLDLLRLTLHWDELEAGLHSVTAEVSDPIDWVIADRPETMDDTAHFSIEVEEGVPSDDDDSASLGDNDIAGAGCASCSLSAGRPRAMGALLYLCALVFFTRRDRRVKPGRP
jgi:hypothetical protein